MYQSKDNNFLAPIYPCQGDAKIPWACQHLLMVHLELQHSGSPSNFFCQRKDQNYQMEPEALDGVDALKFWLSVLPEDIVSDHRVQFISWVWQGFCKRLNINVSLSSGYHAQSNDLVKW